MTTKGGGEVEKVSMRRQTRCRAAKEDEEEEKRKKKNRMRSTISHTVTDKSVHRVFNVIFVYVCILRFCLCLAQHVED